MTTRRELEAMSRSELIDRALRLGVPRPEVMTRVELADEIIRRVETDAGARRRARGWLGVARDLVASLIEQGLNMPDAAKLVRTGAFPPTRIVHQPPVATVTLAEIYATQGHVKRALAMLDEVLTKEPDHTLARSLRERLAGEPREDDEASLEEDEARLEAEDEAAESEREPESERESESEPEPLRASQPAPASEPVAVTVPAAALAATEPSAAEVTEPGLVAVTMPAVATEPEAAVTEPVRAVEPLAVSEPEPRTESVREVAPATEVAPPTESVRDLGAETGSGQAVEREVGPETESVRAPVREAEAPREEVGGGRKEQDALVLLRAADGRVRLHWELSPRSVERGRGRWPNGAAVVRLVAVEPSLGGPRAVEREVAASVAVGWQDLTDISARAAVRGALGWAHDGEFSPFCVGTEIALGEGQTPFTVVFNPHPDAAGVEAVSVHERAAEVWR